MGVGLQRIMKIGNNKKIWKIISFLMILVFIGLSFFAFYYIRDTNKKISEVSAENVTNNVTLNDYTTKITNENMKHLEKIFNSTFTTDQLTELAAKNYSYVLLVNGNIQGNSNEAYISSSRLIVSLVETIAENSLPTSILDLGRIHTIADKGNDFSSNLTLTANNKEFVKTINEKNGITTVNFTCNDLKVGDIVTIFFSDEIKDRMSLTDNYLEIFYN